MRFRATATVLAVFAFCFLFLFACPATQAATVPSHTAVFIIGQPSYTLDGETRTMDARAFTENGRTYVPIRYLAYCCGVPDSGVHWDGNRGEVTLRLSDLEVKVWSGSKTLTRNGMPQTMDATVVSRGGRTYLPARFVAEAFGYRVDWHSDRQAVLVYPPSQEPPAIPGANAPSPGVETPPGGWVGKTAQVAVPVIDIRAGASTGSRSIASASKGSSLAIIGAKGEWLEVKAPSGTTGWVRLRDVTIVNTDHPSQGDPHAGLNIETEYAGARDRVIIQAPAPMEYVLFTLKNPNRIVLDVTGIPGVELPDDLSLDSPVCTGIRTGWQDDGAKARLVLDLAGSFATTRYRAELSPDKSTLVIELWRAANALDDRIVVLDPGHGGTDPGAISASGIQEKVANLAMALETARLLREKGIEVILTRDADRFVELMERPRIANEAGANLFVSIHCNANYSSSYHGTSTYYSDTNIYGGIAEHRRLADIVQAEMLRMLGRKDVGVRTAGFVVTRYTRMPSCLVEVAFLSNPQEAALLAQDGFRDGAAHAIANAVIKYFQSL